jgi:hypothetical protein
VNDGRIGRLYVNHTMHGLLILGRLYSVYERWRSVVGFESRETAEATRFVRPPISPRRLE